MAKYLTIGELARRSGVSRSTLLYYERAGVLVPSSRSSGSYRLYSCDDTQRLDQIKLYRGMGLPIKKIMQMLTAVSPEKSHESVKILQKHLEYIAGQIDQLRSQQEDIIRLLEQMQPKTKRRKRGKMTRALSDFRKNVSHLNQENQMIKKDRWVEIMAAAGFSEEDMKNWHRQFEKLEPEAHQEFLESLDIKADEIAAIRKWSREA